MNIYIDIDTGFIVSDAVAAGLTHVELRSVTNDEFEALLDVKRLAEMTQEEKFLVIERAFDKHIDDIAEARGYGRVGVRPSASCIGFAGFSNQWQAEAIKFAQWSSTCCALLIQGQQDVIAGTRAMPTPAEAIAELPPIVW